MRGTGQGRNWKSAALAAGVLAASLALAAGPGGVAGAGPNDQTDRASIAHDGSQVDNASIDAAISGDGRYVAFESSSTDVVPGDTNGATDVFLRDRRTGATSRASVDSSGTAGNNTSENAAVSDDGRYVAFESAANNLVPGDTNGLRDVFVHDRRTGGTTRVNVDSSGTQAAGGHSDGATISADGRYVAFRSESSNLVAGDTNENEDVFVHDRQTGVTTRVSVDSSGAEGNGFSRAPHISADGRYVAFESTADNLVAGDENGQQDIFLHDRQSGTTTRVNLDSLGNEADLAQSDDPIVFGDGRYVAFESQASNLVPGDTNGTSDVFVRDRQAGTTTRVSVDSSGVQANSLSRAPSAGESVTVIAFESHASNLVASDTNGEEDVFVHDLASGQTTRVSVDSAGGQSEGVEHQSRDPAVSRDGRYVAFESTATNLVPSDTNGAFDVFVRTRALPSVVCGSATSIQQGQSGTVAVGGTGFTATPTVAFGAGVVVNSVTHNSATSLSVNVSVASNAVTGGRTATVTNPAGDNAAGGGCLTVTSPPPAPAPAPAPSSASPEPTPAPSGPSGAAGQVVLDPAGGTHLWNLPFLGSLPGRGVMGDPVAVDTGPGGSYYVLERNGGVHVFGGTFHGSIPGRRADGADIPAGLAFVDIAVGPDGSYYLVLDEVGGVHLFGPGGAFHGSVPGRGVTAQAVAIETGPGGSYVVLDDAGGVHVFGPGAAFHGSPVGRGLTGTMVDLGVAADGSYVVAEANGAVHVFGGTFHGSLPGRGVSGEVVAIAVAPDGTYHLLEANGAVHAFGGPFFGSLPERGLLIPVLDLALFPG